MLLASDAVIFHELVSSLHFQLVKLTRGWSG